MISVCSPLVVASWCFRRGDVNPGRIALAHAKLVLFAVVVLAAFGVHAYMVAPQSMFPTMSFSRIDIVADAGDLPPEQINTAITRPIEQALEALPAIVRVRGSSSQGSGEVIAEFEPATDPRVDLQYVDQALAQARATIPAAKSVEAFVINPNSEPVVSYALVSPVLSQAVLRQFAETRIVPALYGTPGLGRVLIVGGPKTEFHVDLDPAALGAVGLSAQDVASALADASTVQSVGTGVTHYQRYVFLVDSSLHDVASLRRIPIALKDGSTIPLSSLASVNLGVEPLTDEASYDGQHAVMLSAYGLPGGDAVRMAAEFDERLAAIGKRLGPSVHILPYWNQTRLIVESQRSLRDAIVLGALFAVLVIYLFLRSARITAVAATIIPLAMALAVLLLARSGQSLNLMSVGGLAVAVGLIIDDAIVVIENITRHFAHDDVRDRGATIARAVGELARPMLASTATTVVVFAPLALLGGVTGYFFRALAFTLGASLIVSLTLALFVTPILTNIVIRHAGPIGGRSHPHTLLALYEPILRWALRHRILVVAGAASSLLVTALVLADLPSDFLPSMNEGEFEIRYAMPTGVALGASDAAAAAMERVVLADSDVATEGRITGVDTNGFSPTQPNIGTLRVSLRPGASYEEVSEHLRADIAGAVPAATLDFHQILEDQINDLSGAPSPITVTLAGPAQERLTALASKLSQQIARVAGVVDPFNGVIYDAPAVRIAPSAAQLSLLGLQNSDVVLALAANTQGIVATSIAQESRMVPVRVRVGDADPGAGAAGFPLFTKAGSPSLGSVASISAPQLASEINDENGQRVVRVTANIGGASLSSVIAGIKEQIAVLGMPPGYTASIGGAYEAQQQSFRDFAKVLALAVILVFGVMLANFGSLRLPLVILTAIPLALIGVAVALFVTRTPINVSSFMGLLLLVGIVVKNGILLIDVANKQRQAGAAVDEALIEAGKERLRPIVMTTLAAIAGLLPLAVGNGSGAEMQRPLAIAVIGGLSTATIFTLLVIPVLYSILIGGARRLNISAVAASLMLALIGNSASARADTFSTAPAPPLAFAGFSLSDAQEAGVAHSPEVAQSAAAYGAAQAELDQARTALGLSATLGYAEAPQGGFTTTIASRITSSALQLSLADLLAYRPSLASSVANAHAAQADLANAQRLERINVIGLYYAALKAAAIAAARTDALALATAQEGASRKRVSAGDAPRLDAVRAHVQVAQARADLALARAAAANAADALQRETEGPSLVLGPVAPSAPMLVLDPQAAVLAAQETRSDVQSAREGVLAAQAALRAAQISALPPVTLAAGYNTGVDSGTRIGGPAVSAQVTFPVSSPARAKIEAQRAQLAEAQAKDALVERRVALEVAGTDRDAAAAIEAESASNDALHSAREELDATVLGYGSGATSSLEVDVARSAYEQALIGALSATYDRVAAQETLRVELTR
jgi:CzcA family heavy metal efflux pump